MLIFKIILINLFIRDKINIEKYNWQDADCVWVFFSHFSQTILVKKSMMKIYNFNMSPTNAGPHVDLFHLLDNSAKWLSPGCPLVMDQLRNTLAGYLWRILAFWLYQWYQLSQQNRTVTAFHVGQLFNPIHTQQ